MKDISMFNPEDTIQTAVDVLARLLDKYMIRNISLAQQFLHTKTHLEESNTITGITPVL
jgi:hypothetical protein